MTRIKYEHVKLLVLSFPDISQNSPRALCELFTMAQQSTLAAALGEIQELTELEGKAAELRRNGNHLEALKCLERVLLLRQEAYGSNSYEVDAASVLTGEYCNMLAMKCLQERNFPVCQQLLKKAASLAKRSPALQITTYNNFACLFRRQDKLRLALDFLLKAIQIEARLDHVRTCHAAKQ